MPNPIRSAPQGGMALVPGAIAKGLGTALIAGLLGSLVTGLVIYFVPMTEGVSNTILIVVNLAAALAGGVSSAKASQTHGWLNGGVSGLLFMSTLWLIQAVGFVPVENLTMLGALIPLAVGLVAGGIGGMFGIALNG